MQMLLFAAVVHDASQVMPCDEVTHRAGSRRVGCICGQIQVGPLSSCSGVHRRICCGATATLSSIYSPLLWRLITRWRMPRVRSAFHSSAATFGCVYLFEPGGSTAACLQANQPLRAVIEIHLEWAHLSLLSTEVVAALMRSAAALCCGREAAGCVAATTFSRVTCTFACISALPT